MRAARLGDVVASMKNGIYKPASEYIDDGVPCLRMYNIEAGTIAWRDIKRMRLTPEEQEDYGLREGDLLVNRVNSRELVGKSAFVPASIEPSVFESKNIRVRLARDRAEPKFINYQLLAGGSRHFANDAQQVVGMASISQGQLAAFPIVLAEIDQQRRIVAEIEKQFSRLDEAVANLQRVKANLRRYVAGTLTAAVNGELATNGAGPALSDRRTNQPYEALERVITARRSRWQGKYREPARYDKEGLPTLPMGWGWSSLDALSWDSSYGTSAKCSYENEGVPVLRIPNVQRGALDLSDLKFAPDSLLLAGDEAVSAGDLLIIRTNGSKSLIGRAAAVRAQPTRTLAFASYLIRFRLADYDGLSEWVSIVWQESRMRAWIESRAATSAGQHNISQSVLATAAIPLPPLAEQHRIVAEVDRRLSIVRGVEAEVDANLKRAQALRQAILARAFSA